MRTAIIMARKSQGEIEIVSIGNEEVLGQDKVTVTRGTGGSDVADSGSMVEGALEDGMWGSLVGTAGGS